MPTFYFHNNQKIIGDYSGKIISELLTEDFGYFRQSFFSELRYERLITK